MGRYLRVSHATHALPRATENNWFQKAQAQKNPADLAACGVGQLLLSFRMFPLHHEGDFGLIESFVVCTGVASILCRLQSVRCGIFKPSLDKLREVFVHASLSVFALIEDSSRGPLQVTESV
jgi:hypothetical protein